MRPANRSLTVAAPQAAANIEAVIGAARVSKRYQACFSILL
jgi:hypothetical protein